MIIAFASADQIVFSATLTTALTGSLLTLVLIGLFWTATRNPRSRLVRPNFQGRPVRMIGGIAATFTVVFSLLLPLVSDRLWDQAHKVAAAAVFACVGFAVLGVIDDLFGDRTVRGFKGHVRSLVTGKRLTTGLIKLVGGGTIGFAAGVAIALTRTAQPLAIVGLALLYGCFIALFANTSNLLDLRPGRCLAAIVVLSVPCIVGLGWSDSLLAAAVFGSAVALYPVDAKAKIMLGDCGSNALGAVVGALYCALLPVWGVAVGVVLLAGFQIWCETHSLTKFIESRPVLRMLDRKIGTR
jgi:UDP-GlcNAc:undecaprenyl-phosphate GlcNAc-1-phosphate transferase